MCCKRCQHLSSLSVVLLNALSPPLSPPLHPTSRCSNRELGRGLRWYLHVFVISPPEAPSLPPPPLRCGQVQVHSSLYFTLFCFTSLCYSDTITIFNPDFLFQSFFTIVTFNLIRAMHDITATPITLLFRIFCGAVWCVLPKFYSEKQLCVRGHWTISPLQ
jgi:hypothetical protein